jgi:hypothetical protein
LMEISIFENGRSHQEGRAGHEVDRGVYSSFLRGDARKEERGSIFVNFVPSFENWIRERSLTSFEMTWLQVGCHSERM